MGGSSSKKLDRYVKATQNPERILKFAKQLDISQQEIKRFFDIFDKMDKDHSGEISVDEFFMKFDLDWNSFGKNIFAAMDISGDNRVEFVEFFVGLWNYCTLQQDTLIKFAFDMFDLDGSGSIDSGEFRELISMIHGGTNMETKAEQMLKVFDKDRSGHVTFTEFLQNAKNTPSLMMEPFSLQRKMRENCMGNAYWNAATKRRIAKAPNGEDLISLYYRLYHDDQKLDRQALRNRSQGSKVGQVKFKGMTSKTRVACLHQPSTTSERVARLMPNEYVVIEEELETGGKLWFKIKADEGLKRSSGWVLSSFITIENGGVEVD